MKKIGFLLFILILFHNTPAQCGLTAENSRLTMGETAEVNLELDLVTEWLFSDLWLTRTMQKTFQATGKTFRLEIKYEIELWLKRGDRFTQLKFTPKRDSSGEVETHVFTKIAYNNSQAWSAGTINEKYYIKTEDLDLGENTIYYKYTHTYIPHDPNDTRVLTSRLFSGPTIDVDSSFDISQLSIINYTFVAEASEYKLTDTIGATVSFELGGMLDGALLNQLLVYMEREELEITYKAVLWDDTGWGADRQIKFTLQSNPSKEMTTYLETVTANTRLDLLKARAVREKINIKAEDLGIGNHNLYVVLDVSFGLKGHPERITAPSVITPKFPLKVLPEATLNLAVSINELVPSYSEGQDSLTLKFTISNVGELNIPEKSKLRITIDGQVREESYINPTIPIGDSIALQRDYDLDDSLIIERGLRHEVMLEVNPPENLTDINMRDNRAKKNVNLDKRIDLVLKEVSVVNGNSPFSPGAGATVNLSVKNRGTERAKNAIVELKGQDDTILFREKFNFDTKQEVATEVTFALNKDLGLVEGENTIVVTIKSSAAQSRIDVSDPSKCTKSVSLTIIGVSNAKIRIILLEPTSLERPGKTIKLQFAVENDGDGTFGISSSPEVVVSLGGERVTGYTCPKLEPGSSHTFPVTDIQIDEAGTHTIKIEVDPDNVVIENNEEDNIFTKVVTVEEAPEPPPPPEVSGTIDLAITEFYVRRCSLYWCCISLELEIRNNGSLTAEGTLVVKLDDNPIHTQEVTIEPQSSTRVVKMPPRESVENAISMDVSEHHLVAEVIPLDEFKHLERDTNNNLSEVTIDIPKRTRRAPIDLAVEKIQLNTSAPKNGEEIIVTATIINKGNAEAKQAGVFFGHHGPGESDKAGPDNPTRGLTQIATHTFKPGESFSVEYKFVPATEGKYTVEVGVAADSNQSALAAKDNLDDNYDKLEFDVSGVERFIIRPIKDRTKIDPTEPKQDQKITIRIPLENTGEVDAEVELKIFIDGKEIYSEIIKVKANAIEWVQHSFVVSEPGEHTSGIRTTILRGPREENYAEFKFFVKGPMLVDFSIKGDIEAIPSKPKKGETVRIKVPFWNICTTDVSAELDIFYDGRKIHTEKLEVEADELSKGWVEHSFAIKKSGEHKIEAVITPLGNYKKLESNKNNNHGELSFFVGEIDFAISGDIKIVPRDIKQGEAFTIKVPYRNTGNTDAKAKLDLSYDNITHICEKDLEVKPGSVSQGWAECSYGAPAAGGHRIIATIIVPEEYKALEPNKDNNRREQSFNVSGKPIVDKPRITPPKRRKDGKMADFALGDIEIAPSKPMKSDTVTVRVPYRNLGNLESTASVKITYDSPIFKDMHLAFIDAKAEASSAQKWVEYSFIVDRAGDYKLKVWINSDLDTNRTNNYKVLPFTVGDIDFAIAHNIEIVPYNPRRNGELTIKVPYRNMGDIDALAQLKIFYDGELLYTEDMKIKTGSVSQGMVEYTFTADEAGEHEIEATQKALDDYIKYETVWTNDAKKLVIYVDDVMEREEYVDFSNIQQAVERLYQDFQASYRSGDVNGVLRCVSREWESSSGQSFYDLDDRLNNIFTTFDRLDIRIDGLNYGPSDDPDYSAKVSYHIVIEGTLSAAPDVQHREVGDVTDYIKKDGDKYLIGKTVGKGAF
ncbi:CARDB domain-containing protein [Candidatus Omnitrophota bacterium]